MRISSLNINDLGKNQKRAKAPALRGVKNCDTVTRGLSA